MSAPGLERYIHMHILKCIRHKKNCFLHGLNFIL
jgi:hypothetical protein